MLFAAEAGSRTTFEWSRLQAYTERWHFLVLAVVCALAVAFVSYLYRRDTVELRAGARWLLLALRVTALAGLLVYYLHLEKRTEREVTHNSRVLVLVDTSLSMGLHDVDASAVPAAPNRLDQVTAVLGDGKLVEKLRALHDVVLVRFDSQADRIVSLAKLSSDGVMSDEASSVNAAPSASRDASPTPDESANWQKQLTPHGVETRLGQALRQIIHDERSAPVAGIVIFSDGGQNAGVDPAAAVAAAKEAKIPLYTVGLGSSRRPANVRVSDFVAPARAYPGDSFAVTGYIQAEELANRTVKVELLSRPAGEGKAGDGKAGAPGKLEASERVTLAGRGEVIPVRFEVSPEEKGRRTFRLQITAPAEDSNPGDNQQEVDVEIVDRKTNVLLIASGPGRDYTYLRNMLRRDKQVVVDAWLQSIPPEAKAVSQDANKLLDAFPSSPQELFEYDCIVAIDPDWRQLDADQVDLLERWVAEKAGGLIGIAGPVETGQWVQDARLAKLRALYPVEFNRRLAMLEDGRFGSEHPWPIEFTREGLEAEFLWLTDSAASNQQVWSSFPGVYGYYSTRGAKPGATVYARYSDPESVSGEGLPVYMAGHFYGSGRVFYLGSGEMWRLRALEDAYFDQIYTKLIRHVSQGRLLVGSSRGMLLVERDRYLLGNNVVIRAQLSSPQFEPLDQPTVPLQIVHPDSTVSTMQLAADPARKGMYVGHFTAIKEGAYRLELAIPGSETEQLTRRIQVKVPNLERENPERNDALLSEIAQSTGGLYYVGAETVLGTKGAPPLVQQLKDRTETTFLSGVTDLDFERQWMTGLLGVMCGALFLEWLIRRLSKLA